MRDKILSAIIGQILLIAILWLGTIVTEPVEAMPDKPMPVPEPKKTPIREYLVFQHTSSDGSVMLVEIQGNRCRASVWGIPDLRGVRVLLREPLRLKLIGKSEGELSDDLKSMPTPVPHEDILTKDVVEL